MINNENNQLLDEVDDRDVLDKMKKALDATRDLSNNGPIALSSDADEQLEEPQETEVPEAEEDGQQLHDEEDSEELEESESDKKEKKVSKDRVYGKSYIRKLHNEKHKAQAEKAALEGRNRELEQMLSESLKAGTYHYGKSAYSELDRAKEAQRQALRNGDEDGLLKAQEDIIAAMFTIKELEKWANETNRNVSHQPVPQAPQHDYDHQNIQEVVLEWLESHPYLDPDSRKYNPTMASRVNRFVKDLDKKQTCEPYSYEYFDEIDDYIDKLKSRKTVNTSASVSPVGGVRNSYNGANVKSNNPADQLTQEEKNHIRSMSLLGVTEESYLSAKRKHLKENANV